MPPLRPAARAGARRGRFSGSSRSALAVGVALLVLGAAVQSSGAPPGAPPEVDAKRIAGADRDPGNWLTHGRTYDEQRFSPLTQIDAGNVGQLGLAWYQELNTRRGVEGTPLEADGVLYNTSAWNVTSALDAKTGKLLWTYDPEVPPAFARVACCDDVSRGPALWKGKLYIATLDGRLIALDARTGAVIWSVQTFDRSWPYSITGAPRVFEGKVLIGNGGAEFGVRGYLTAYDAETGRQVWRFYMVPGDPAKGFENAAMKMAAKTWTGEWWKMGGGGTPWDAFVYDPQLKLVYIGGGNAGPWVQKYRSPGGGDNLFVASIVAVRVDTGEYVWHYQETPGDQWDYTATQPIILADLEIGGRRRKVLMQAPKNGFFYVLDRTNGQLISAQPYDPVINWAKGVDPKTGRPIFNPEALYGEKPVLTAPAGWGAHNWQPMSFSPLTRLVYFPVSQSYQTFSADPDFKFRRGGLVNTGAGYRGYADERKAQQNFAIANERDWLTAWDPVAQREAWRVELPAAANGGTLVTAGNLVFEGNAKLEFAAYRADTGEKLWQMPLHQIPMSGPIAYSIDGEEYIAVNAGMGGGRAHNDAAAGRGPEVTPARLVVFKLGGTAQLPPFVPDPVAERPPPRMLVGEDVIAAGEALYAHYCVTCHGVRARGGVKDLRYMSDDTRRHFEDIVIGGLRAKQGMAPFADVLTSDDVRKLNAYLISRADEDWGRE
jgi:quinohemoprotein ethanol dehydrogenase